MDNTISAQTFLSWTSDEARQFGRVPQVNRHRVHELPWFSDEGLLSLIEDQPRSGLRVFMSGNDPERRQEDWHAVDTEGASAADILESVRVGRMWLNLQRIDTTNARFGELGAKLYGELKSQCAHFKPLWTNRAFLFVSSPNAMVYLHADYQPNMLWHIRGHKKIWIYPAYDERIVSRRRIEEICAGGEDDIDYQAKFDDWATAFSISPGDTVSWPARSPHRVLNGNDLNVSLSTFHETVDDYKLVTDHRAQYFFREKFPALANLGNGTLAPVRRLAFKACQRVGWVTSRPAKEYYAEYRIDPGAPLGVSRIKGGPVLTEHSRLAAARRG